MISNENPSNSALPAPDVNAVRNMIIKELEDLKFKIFEIKAGKLELTTEVEKEVYISSTVINKDEIIMALGCGIFVEMSADEAVEFIDARLADLRN